MSSDLVDRVRRRLVDEPGSADLAGAVRSESAGIVDDAVFAELRREVAAELHGAGPLEDLLATARASPTCSSTVPARCGSTAGTVWNGPG